MRADISARAEMMALDRIVARVDSLMGMLDAVRYGMGIGLLLGQLGDDEEDLVPMAEPLDELDTELWSSHILISSKSLESNHRLISCMRNSAQVTKSRVSMREDRSESMK